MRKLHLIPLISIVSALVHANAFAVEDQAVMIFNLEKGMYATVDNPTCTRSLNISKLLDSDAFKAIAAKSGPKAALVLGTTQAVLDAVQNQGGSIAGIINDFNGGSWSRCETACVVLPDGASIKEIRISSRSGVERVSYLVNGPNPHDPNSPNVLKFGGVLNAGSMGDFSGYRGLQYNRSSRSVCTTAKNWSGDQPTSQTVRVIFER